MCKELYEMNIKYILSLITRKFPNEYCSNILHTDRVERINQLYW